MLAPLAIARRLVVYPRKELEIVNRHLFRLDAQLVVQLAHCGATHALNRCLESNASLSRYAERMRAACICPHIWESDLLGRALLEKKTVLGVEEEDGEGAVEQSSVDVFH